jgi:hypothetical protein
MGRYLLGVGPKMWTMAWLGAPMLQWVLVYTYVVLFAISLLLEQPIPLAIGP